MDQQNCLEQIKIGMLSSVIKFFCNWIKDGCIDFCGIELSFKSPLDKHVEKELFDIISSSKYKGGL